MLHLETAAVLALLSLLVLTYWCLSINRSRTGLRIYGPLYLGRYLAEALRDKYTQYTERPGDGAPFNLVTRSWIYRAAKGIPTSEGFGSTKKLHIPGTHTIQPAMFGILASEMPADVYRVQVGRDGRQFIVRYPCNRSAMSFGALGGVATRALSDGCALLCQGYPSMEGALDNTGEGGLSPHHCPVTPEAQAYLDRMTLRAAHLGYTYRYRFDCTATSDGSPVAVPLQLSRYGINKEGRVYVRNGNAPLGVSEQPRRLIVQIGPSLAGCHLTNGTLDLNLINDMAGLSFVAGFEIKAQQGAKPNDGGTVLASKLTDELCALRGIQRGKDYHSPERLPFVPRVGLAEQVQALMQVVTQIQGLPSVRSRGLIVGYKMTYSGDDALIEMAKHLRRGVGPDYLVVDGAEGGTGAADPAMMDRVGIHTYYGIARTHQVLQSLGVRSKVALVASGQLVDPGTVATALCLGADYCNTARGAMMSMGCIQAMQCHSGQCPAGITTHNSWRQRGLDPTLKCARYAAYQASLRATVVKLARAAGVDLTRGERFGLRNLFVALGPGRDTLATQVYRWRDLPVADQTHDNVYTLPVGDGWREPI